MRADRGAAQRQRVARSCATRCHVPVIKVVHVGTDFGLEEAEPYRGHAAALLLDTLVTGKAGGTSQTFDWQATGRRPRLGSLFVAGGPQSRQCRRVHRCAAPVRRRRLLRRRGDLRVSKTTTKIVAFCRCRARRRPGGLSMSELFPSAENVYAGPDAAGFFGAYGGRFVPETVIPALEELTAAYEAASERSRVRGRARRPAPRLRRSRHAAVPRRAARRGGRARRGLPQARGPVPHRRAQDQQHASASACSPSAWARSASSPRRARASTASPRRRPRRSWTSSAPCSWASRTSAASRSTSTR